MTLSVTAKAQAGKSPLVKITVTSTTSGPSPVPDNTQIRVWRVHPDNVSHRVLTAADPRLIGGSWTWLDAHAPFNVPFTYLVQAVTSTPPSVLSAPVWLLSKRTWLIHPTDGELAVMVEKVSAIAERTRGSRSTEFPLVGGKSVFLSDGVRDGVRGSISFRVAVKDVPKFEALIDDDLPILINTPGTAGWDVKWLWAQPLDVVFDNKGGINSYPYRQVTIPFKESADPDLEFQPDWTSADAAAAFATSAAMAAAYATAGDLVTNTRR